MSGGGWGSCDRGSSCDRGVRWGGGGGERVTRCVGQPPQDATERVCVPSICAVPKLRDGCTLCHFFY